MGENTSGIVDPNNPNATLSSPIDTTAPTLVTTPPPVIESPPITREEHNDSVVLMRSVMDEVRQLRLEVIAMRAQSTNSPNAPNVSTQNASIGIEENSSQGTTPILGRNPQFAPPSSYANPTHVQHPHINPVGNPPIIDASNFANWQFLMKSHLMSACTHLWRVIVNGYHPVNPNNLTVQEEIDQQLNATAVNSILKAMTQEY